VKPINHPGIVRTGHADSEMDPELIERMSYGCEFVNDILQEKGPPIEGHWVVFEVRPCVVVNNVPRFEACSYDYAYFEQHAVKVPSGEYVFVAIFDGDELMRAMREVGCEKEATYINETRRSAPLVVVGYGKKKGISVRGLGFVPMQKGGQA
jgi:hypothetical protein